MKSKWLVYAKKADFKAIEQKYGIDQVIARIMRNRDVCTDEEMQMYLNGSIDGLHAPELLKDAQKAVDILTEKIAQHKKIRIIGDYDIDGICSITILYKALKKAGADVDYVVPHRITDGYGINEHLIDNAAAEGKDTILTCDNGIAAIPQIQYAKEHGLTVIVTDHHDIPFTEENGEKKLLTSCADAIVDPKQPDCEYPFDKICGAVVAYKVMQILYEKLGLDKTDFKEYTELAAIATVGDVVDLKDENRVIVRQGLAWIATTKNTGLRALIDKSGISEAPSAFHLGYVLGPRINACGRVGEASLGNKLLCSRDDFQAGQLADKLNEFNAQRKEIEAYVLLSAIEMLEGTPQEYPIAFAAGKDWHQGVVGIVAGKLKERYNVPAFVMSIEPDEVKGSARSVPGVDLGALIIAAKEKGLLTKGGGHTMAAGFSLSEDKIEAFRRFAGEYVRQKLGEEDVAPVIEVDSALDLLGANTDFAAALELLEPFGAGNAEPKIVLEHVRIVKPGIVGAGHVRCFLTSGNGGSLKAMAFKIADTELGKTLLNSQGAVFDIAGVLRRDNWQGRNSVQFIIDDAIRCE